MSQTMLSEKRPWGFFDQFCLNESTTVKIITVNPKQQLSVQRHRFRDELWVVIDPNLIATLNDIDYYLEEYRRLFIEKNTTHTIRNVGDTPARFLEVSFGIFDENDIERFSDKYGRV